MLQENATADRQPRAVRLHWYVEAAAILAFYLVYSWVRNQYGSATVAPIHALHNAQKVVDLERAWGCSSSPTCSAPSWAGRGSSGCGTSTTAPCTSSSPAG